MTASVSLTPSPDPTNGSPGTTGQGLILRVWVPPQFDPQADTRAGKILRDRLAEFSSRRPGIQVQVRVKTEQGAGGLYDALTAASAAAHGAMPDLIALPQEIFQAAAVKGLLRPMDGLTSALDDSDWYNYARQLNRLQSGTTTATGVFGLPFAGDLLIQAVHTAKVSELTSDWDSLIELAMPLAFPAADPRGLFTLALYQSIGGEIYEGQGRPVLQAEPLAKVLTVYQQARQAGVLPEWLTQYQDYQGIWNLFGCQEHSGYKEHSKQEQGETPTAVNNTAPVMSIIWASQYLGCKEHSGEINIVDSSTVITDTRLAPLPVPDDITRGKRFTLGTGWVWAFAAVDRERQLAAVELAEFLTESNFLASWTQAAGLLPPRPSSLAAWRADVDEYMAADIILIEEHSADALLLPPSDVLSSLGLPLQEATLQIIKGQSDPQTAAQKAADRLFGP